MSVSFLAHALVTFQRVMENEMEHSLGKKATTLHLVLITSVVFDRLITIVKVLTVNTTAEFALTLVREGFSSVVVFVLILISNSLISASCKMDLETRRCPIRSEK